MVIFAGDKGVDTYRAIVLRAGLRMYAQTRMKPNSAWTPTAMLKGASEITGNTYRRGDYVKAANDLSRWIELFGTTGHDDTPTISNG